MAACKCRSKPSAGNHKFQKTERSEAICDCDNRRREITLKPVTLAKPSSSIFFVVRCDVHQLLPKQVKFHYTAGIPLSSNWRL